MRVQPRWSLDALAPLATGLLWLLTGFSEGALLSIVACVIGVPLLATATALLLWPGDRQITHYLALVALPSPVVALLVAPWFGFASLALVAGGLLSFLVAGRVATRQMVLPEGVPPAPLSFGVCRKVATDEALLGFFVSFAHIPRDRAVARALHEVEVLRLGTKRGLVGPRSNRGDTSLPVPIAPQHHLVLKAVVQAPLGDAAGRSVRSGARRALNQLCAVQRTPAKTVAPRATELVSQAGSQASLRRLARDNAGGRSHIGKHKAWYGACCCRTRHAAATGSSKSTCEYQMAQPRWTTARARAARVNEHVPSLNSTGSCLPWVAA